MSEPVLVIMAAGLGSRFGGGGLKQVTPVGPCGERIIDYSMYDAWKAGFRRVVCVIKEEMLEDFRKEIAAPIEKYMQIEYAFQRLSDIPEGCAVPEGREKPWGTGHAALVGARKAAEVWGSVPYAVINADDFYGREAYEKIYGFLTGHDGAGEKMELCMVGYEVGNTVTDNGTVSRGVCEVEDGILKKVTERTKIAKLPEDKIGYTEDDGKTWTELSADTPVSMQIWGFRPETTGELEAEYVRFFQNDLPGNPVKGEFYLPFAVNAFVQDGRARVQVLRTGDRWYGITYLVDRQSVVDAVQRFTTEGKYPTPLWK